MATEGPEPPDMDHSASRAPSNENEQRVHALNIHGQLFERWCEQVARTTDRWNVELVDEPLEALLDADRVVEGTVDLLIEHGEKRRLTVPVECKKANPELVHWVFFPTRYDLPVQVRRHRRIPSNQPSGLRLARDLVTLPLAATACNAGRELRGDYPARKQNWTMTSNTAIRDAALQVGTADRILVRQDLVRAASVAEQGAGGWPEQRIFIPMIVTTAELFLCRFDPSLIDPATGELPRESAKFEGVSELVFEYPLPPRLQLDDEVRVYGDGSFERSGTRLNVLIVNSRNFEAMLRKLADDMTRTLIFREPD